MGWKDKRIWSYGLNKMIIDPFLNNPKKLDYKLSNSIYKPKTKKKGNKKLKK